jgi:hypothetical protein
VIGNRARTRFCEKGYPPGALCVLVGPLTSPTPSPLAERLLLGEEDSPFSLGGERGGRPPCAAALSPSNGKRSNAPDNRSASCDFDGKNSRRSMTSWRNALLCFILFLNNLRSPSLYCFVAMKLMRTPCSPVSVSAIRDTSDPGCAVREGWTYCLVFCQFGRRTRCQKGLVKVVC